MRFFKFLFGNKFINRAARVSVDSLHDVFLYIDGINSTDTDTDTDNGNLTIKMKNLSTTGIGFSLNGAAAKFTNQMNLTGTLKIAQKSLPIKMQVAFVKGSYVGTSITNISHELNAAISNYFKSEIAAINSGPVISENLYIQNSGQPYWYFGNNGCEFFYVVNDDIVKKFQLKLFKYEINWDDTQGLVLAQASYDEEYSTLYDEGDYLNIVPFLPQDIIESAKKFIQNLDGLPNNHKDFVCSIINQTINASF